jgi:hypothetical protein
VNDKDICRSTVLLIFIEKTYSAIILTRLLLTYRILIAFVVVEILCKGHVKIKLISYS